MPRKKSTKQQSINSEIDVEIEDGEEVPGYVPEPGETLNSRSRAYCQHFMVTGSKTDSYYLAGFKPSSRETAGKSAYKLHNRPDVREYITYLQQKRAERLAINAERATLELARVGYTNISDVASWDQEKGLKFKASNEIDPDSMAAIAEVIETTFQGRKTISVKMHSKTPALKAILKHVGADVDLNQLIARLRSYGYDVVDKQAPVQVEEDEDEEEEE